MSERVAVVIPYYQRRAGLLARAVRSVFNQSGAVDPWVVVVDDGRPVPAEGELDSLEATQRERVRLIRQPNGGAGKARNTGLNALPDGIDFFALLDPDDFWKDDHLALAMAAMRRGYDFYFCDMCLEDDPSGHFSKFDLDPSDHTLIDPEHDIYAVNGDFFDRSLRKASVPTSAAVMRRSRLGHLRFHSPIRPVGEDLLFWLDVARETDRIAFSTRTSVIYGEGVSGAWSDDWASGKSLSIINGFGGYYDEVTRRFTLTPEQARLVGTRRRESQADFVHTVFGMIKRGRLPDPGLLCRYTLRHPRVLAIAPLVLAARLTGRRS